MLFGSVCSGIEAASVAWSPLGWKAAWFSEIEPFPCAVLAHHFPDVANMGDMTTLPDRIANGEVFAPDVLCGGTPCQAFSVAGKRQSLDDHRGNLTLTFCDIADAIDETRSICGDDPCVVFWENVPGVLSTKDNAFGCFLGRLVGSDVPLSSGAGKWPSVGYVTGPKRKAAWRVLDAQYFGVPQRRRRVFVVASARDGFDPTKILFEQSGLRGDSEKGRTEGKGTTAFTLGGFASYREGVGTLKAQGGDLGGGSETLVVGNLASSNDSNFPTNKKSVSNNIISVEPTIFECHQQDARYNEKKLCPTVVSRYGTGGGNIPLVLNNLNKNICHKEISFFNHHTQDGRVTISNGVSQTISARDGASGSLPLVVERGTNEKNQGGVCIVHSKENPCYCLAENTIGRQPHNGGNGNGYQEGISYTLNATGVHGACYPIDTMNITERGDGSNGMGIGANGDPSYTLSRGHHHGVATRECVRRLTPVECERLQGFPDNWTRIPYRGKSEEMCPDSPRYKAIGNSWAVPCVRWIGERLDKHLKEIAK